eukprot:3489887-Pyramimonas_sp.AAC.1
MSAKFVIPAPGIPASRVQRCPPSLYQGSGWYPLYSQRLPTSWFYLLLLADGSAPTANTESGQR